MTKNKEYSKIFTIALISILAISSLAIVLPTVSAHDPPWEIPTWAFMSVSPNPIGVNQEALIVMWLNEYPRTAWGAFGDRFNDYWIDITLPDGTSTTLGPFESDPVGAQFTTYTPTQLGTYEFVFRFDGDTMTLEYPRPGGTSFIGSGAFENDTYLPSTSDTKYLEVVEEQVQDYFETPLPEGYWERPISAINRNWWAVSGSWLNAGDTPNNFQKYSTGPETSHIMWTKPYWEGGIMGGQYDSTSYYTGRSYEPFGTNMIVLNGRLYYNIQTPPRHGTYCVDLRTGEEIWFHNTTGPISMVTGGFGFDFSGDIDTGALSFGQIYNYDSPNQHGGFPYLWSTDGPAPNTWMMFDGFSGNYICSIGNVSSGGTSVYGKDGSILRYSIAGTPNPMGPFFPDTPPFYLRVWNTSRVIWYKDYSDQFDNEYWLWRPDLGKTFDGNNGWSLNVSIPEVEGSIRTVIEGEYLIVGSSGANTVDGLEPGTFTALSLESGSEGTVLWTRNFNPPYDYITDVPGAGGVFGWGAVEGPYIDVENNIFWFQSELEQKVWVYDLDTMQQLWETPNGEDWNFYGQSQRVAYGKLFNTGYGGELDCYDARTGELLWTYSSGTVGFETAYSGTPMSFGITCDEKLYMYSSEHSPTMPLARGRGLRCIDVNTGEELWQIHHWSNDMCLADGYLVDLNLYDNQIYCYGIGPSETTVKAPQTAVAYGENVMIVGMVTDQSAGAKGTPAIADEYMDEWMEYMYMNRPMPENAMGVTVKLSAYDPNGNYQEIGTTTCDTAGKFGLSWTPPVPGDYYIRADFEGSKSYGSSFDTTYMTVGAEPEATPPPPDPTPAPMTDTYVLGMGAAAIIVIIIFGLLILLMLRKR
jgi:outer membrane protein assembly factor BamB